MHNSGNQHISLRKPAERGLFQCGHRTAQWACRRSCRHFRSVPGCICSLPVVHVRHRHPMPPSTHTPTTVRACIRTHPHNFAHVCVRVCVRARARACVRACMHVSTCLCDRVCVCVHACVCTRVCILRVTFCLRLCNECVCTCVRVHVCVHVCVCAHVCAYICACWEMKCESET